MNNLNLAARLVLMDWSALWDFYGAIFASFACVVVMFSFMLLDEVLEQWPGYMSEEWEAAVGQVSLPLPIAVPRRVFYRTKEEYVMFCEELAFWPQAEDRHETWEQPQGWVNDALLDLDEGSWDKMFEYV